ncbi:MAG TPA: 3-isopropylmalate dehydrogenase [Longimicrobiaceae bacterium]|nr:3-isopropylmalate dehydrogenase [Longimicrobiaceae bacterium]
MHRIALLPGDGIGTEVIREAARVLRAVADRDDIAIELVDWPHGADHFLATGATISDHEVDDLRDNYDAILLGALGDSRVPGNQHAREILLGLRFRLDLYINFRPVRLLHESLTPLKDKTERDIDFVIFRENTEGIYVGMGGVFKQGTPDEVAVQEDVNTRKGVERIIRAAFEYARLHDLERVTLSDKANAMEFAGGLWRRVFSEVAEEYPEIENEALYVDMLAMDLVRRPERYRVIVTGNLFGDILSDLGSQLAGGLGLAASANIHPSRTSLFEPVHGSAPEMAGKNIANPAAAILTSALMLRELGHPDSADALERAVRKAVQEGSTTRDLGGTLSTEEMGEAICAELIAVS